VCTETGVIQVYRGTGVVQSCRFTGIQEKFRGTGYKSSTWGIPGFMGNTVVLEYCLTVWYKRTGVQEMYRGTRVQDYYRIIVVM
jgi:hypothetical protein